MLPPVVRSNFVRRARLIETLDQDRPRKLTLVTAPAGFGKTTFLGQWFDHLRGRGLHCCWLSLDRDDAVPVRFLLYFISTLEEIAPSTCNAVRQRVENAFIPDITVILPELVNELASARQEVVVFLDDFHFADATQISEFIALLIDLSPPGFHLVLAGRVRPRLPLANLRAKNDLFELNASAMRFDEAEASDFLEGMHRLGLSREEFTRLLQRSEGWVAGLQLATLSLQQNGSGGDLTEEFSGSLRDVADYLAADVLVKQSETIRNFLLRTSVISRLTAPLCEFLSGEPDAQRLLETLEEQNLFLVPLDQQRKWYRYHHLFQEFLFDQLRRQYPDETVVLYQRAADWFSAAGYPGDAVDYALLAGNIEQAVSLVESQVQDEIMAGRMPRVNDWVNRIPERAWKSNTKLLFAKGTALYHMNQADEAEQVMQLLATAPPNGVPARRLEEQLRILQSGISISRDDVDGILPPLEPPMTGLSDFNAGTTSNIRGYALSAMSEFDRAEMSFDDARRYHKRSGSSFGVVYADCFAGLIDLAKGNLESCYSRFANPSSATAADTYVVPVPAIMRSLVLYEWNRLDEAFEPLRFHLPALEQVGHIKVLTYGYITLAKIFAAKGDAVGAARYFNHCLGLGHSSGLPYRRRKALVESERIRFLIASGRLNEAIDLGESMGIDLDCANPPLPERWERVACLNLLVLARLQIATGTARHSLSTLERLQQLAAAVKRYKRVIECLVVEAGAHSALGDYRTAQSRLVKALELAASNRPLRAFLDEPRSIHATLQSLLLTRTLQLTDPVSAMLNKVCAGISNDPQNRRQPATPHGQQPPLVEPLNARELEILELIASGQSNQVIADRLRISQNTVKWHIKNVFSKLGVNNRTAAVVTAGDLGLLGSA